MGKEYHWEIMIDGVHHRVTCAPCYGKNTPNEYVIWVDDDFLMRIYRESPKVMRMGMERPLDICGESCNFVVWDGEPDLVVNGMMLGRQVEYQRAKEDRKNKAIKRCRIAFWIGLAMTVVANCLIFTEAKHWLEPDDWFSIIAFGFVVMIVSIKMRRKWERWQRNQG